MSSQDSVPAGRPVHLSLVMPCYNEEAVIGYTIPRLVAAFERSGYCLQLVAVDNGSSDRTGAMIRSLAARYAGLVRHRVERNQGYGYGVLCGLPLCTAPWVGIIPADGQVDAEDVVRLYEAAVCSEGRVIAKVRRRFRMDGLRRKVVSTAYNLFVRLLWPTLASIDINGSPKMFPREVVDVLDLRSKGWLLDLELMIKAHYLGLRALELNVFARMRGSGVSHVRPATCWEFFTHILSYRLSNRWKRGLQPVWPERRLPAIPELPSDVEPVQR